MPDKPLTAQRFAYVTGKSGEVVRLVKGEVVVTDDVTPESLDHLVEGGFVGSSE